MRADGVWSAPAARGQRPPPRASVQVLLLLLLLYAVRVYVLHDKPRVRARVARCTRCTRILSSQVKSRQVKSPL
jgi:hypothetical protein